MPRTIAIGDVHGCANEFEELLSKISPNSDDRIIQLGDLVNRGPNSHRVIELCRTYKVESILGNHELRILRAQTKKKTSSLKDYDKETIAQLNAHDWKYLKSLPGYIYDFEREIVFVHGGFLPDELWQTQSIDTITSIQVIDKNGKAAKRSDAPNSPPWADAWNGSPLVIYGHTPRPQILRRTGSIGIDTGCVYGGYLTAYVFEEQKFIQVPARQAYARSKRLPNPVANISLEKDVQ